MNRRMKPYTLDSTLLTQSSSQNKATAQTPILRRPRATGRMMLYVRVCALRCAHSGYQCEAVILKLRQPQQSYMGSISASA